MSGTDRLGRLLAVVPYLLVRPGIRVADAAADLGVTEAQLRDDLQLLFLCGLPGYGPGDLIDMVLDEETVTITFDAGISRPLRLTADEALALVVALRALAEVPGMGAGGALERALAKLESAAGDAAAEARRVTVQMDPGGERLTVVRGAIDRGRALRITYYTAARDATTERVVDPIRVLLVEGRTYLEAWCRRAEAVRRFRLDRIDAATELAEPAAPPAGAGGGDVTGGIFQPEPGDPTVTLRLDRRARWVTEYYPCETVEEQPDGNIVVTLRTGDLGWARRLVLGLGADAEVLSPTELALSVRSAARTALKYYSN
ncbi:MAG TPA: YafY family protein [Mycobacteriales bacterium]|jgi:proteasome accessory factor C|nr:proteasome accessory factor [Actinomycetota bacterium]HEV7755722.1 YafY family protein [Mycobacteriales bacterium]